MPDDDRRPGVRLADTRVPKGWQLYTLVAMAWAERDRRKALAGVVDVATELGTIFGTRMKESDERDAAMIDLTAKLEKMTRTLVRFGVASLVVSIVSLVVAVVALTA